MKLDKLVIILGALLFLSLSGNMFMAGLMIGHSVEADREAPARGPDARPEDARQDEWKQRDQQIQKKLSAEDRAVVEAAKAKDGPQIVALRKTLKEAHAKVEAAQSAEPFDQAAVDDALKAEAAAKSDLVKAMRAARQNVLEKLSPEGRETVKAFAPWKKQGARGQRRREDMGERDAPNPPQPLPQTQTPPQPEPQNDGGDTHTDVPAPTSPAAPGTYGQSETPPQPAPADSAASPTPAQP